jgi:hypothetical protein
MRWLPRRKAGVRVDHSWRDALSRHIVYTQPGCRDEFPVIFSMIIGIVDFGQFLFIHQTLTERAREGCPLWRRQQPQRLDLNSKRRALRTSQRRIGADVAEQLRYGNLQRPAQ